jgi:glycolate oxidase FAD binding subunit
VAQAVEALRARRESVCVIGGRTLAHIADEAPSVRGELATTGLREPIVHEPADLIATCGAGETLQGLQNHLRRAGQILPVWHPEPPRATIGGLVAFGWTGIGRRLFGSLRDRVLEVKVVTGEGKLVRGGAKVVKNVTGFDLPRLFFGSHGTLGVIVEATLKVHPSPPALVGARIRGEPAAVVRRLTEVASAAPQPVECVVRLEAGRATGLAFAPGPSSDAATLLGPLGGEEVAAADEEFASLAGEGVLAGQGLSVRVAVPPARIGDALAACGEGASGIVDVGMGVGWLRLPSAAGVPALRELAEDADGSLVLTSAPVDVRRSIGTWGNPPAGIEMMRRLKAQFDPDGVLGPGRFHGL